MTSLEILKKIEKPSDIVSSDTPLDSDMMMQTSLLGQFNYIVISYML